MGVEAAGEKSIEWIASSYDDLVAMPEDVQDEIGYALDRAQFGKAAPSAKRMKGDLSDIMEITVDDADRTFRGMYTTKFGDVVYVLDVFVKKSTKGIATPARDLDRVRGRYRQAREHYEKHYGNPKRKR